MYTLKVNNTLHLLRMAVASESKDSDVCTALNIILLAANIVLKLSVRSVNPNPNFSRVVVSAISMAESIL